MKKNLSIKAYLTQWLAHCDRTEQEVRRRLIQKEFAPSEVSKTISWARKAKYLDDQKYADRFVQGSAKRKNYSALQIRRKLVNLGIAEEIIQQALNARTRSDIDTVLTLLNKKYGCVPNDRVVATKAARFLERRGFSATVIQKVLMEAFED